MKWDVIITTERSRGVSNRIFRRKKDAQAFAEWLENTNKNVIKTEVVKQGTKW